MNVKQAATRAGVTIKALKYYERIGLIRPMRLANGYRSFTVHDVELVEQVRTLTDLGLSVKGTRPFIECLQQGHAHGDDCPESLAAYHSEISRLDALVSELTTRRAMLNARLAEAASRGFTQSNGNGRTAARSERYGLPENLPVPKDDGSAAHLVGMRLPRLSLRLSSGGQIDLRHNIATASEGRWLIFVYPTTGVPGQDMPTGWSEIPGARGCTAEACAFRDNFELLLDRGLNAIYGLSVQDSTYQRELATRLRLPYPLLCDAGLALRKELRLPVFSVEGAIFYKRLTLVLRGSIIEHVFFPIFPPNEHGLEVALWLERHPVVTQRRRAATN